MRFGRLFHEHLALAFGMLHFHLLDRRYHELHSRQGSVTLYKIIETQLMDITQDEATAESLSDVSGWSRASRRESWATKS
jgi:hypothetical protein